MNTHNICLHGEIRKILTGYLPYLDLCECHNVISSALKTGYTWQIFVICAKGDNFFDLVCFTAYQDPSRKGSTLKKKKKAPSGSKFVPFRVIIILKGGKIRFLINHHPPILQVHAWAVFIILHRRKNKH